MKSGNDVLEGLGKLVQASVAQSGSEFVAAESRDGSLITTVSGDDGVRRQFQVTATELQSSPPPAEDSAQEGAAQESATDGTQASSEPESTDAASDQAGSSHPAQPQAETSREPAGSPAGG